MTIKPLIILPDPVLRQLSQPVETVSAEIRHLADDMLDTMYDAPGIAWPRSRSAFRARCW